MTVKRSREEGPYPSSKKRQRSCGREGWPFDCVDLDLNLDLQEQADHFLKQVGVCRGVHAATDDNTVQHGLQTHMASYSSWQGLSEQSW